MNGSGILIDFGYHELQGKVVHVFVNPCPHFDILSIISEDV